MTPAAASATGERDRPRSASSSFTFDGKPVAGLEGDTIGSALFAAGRRTFSRSFKYHRPRGLMCCAGQCPNCLVQVDGAPGVRACTEPLREGMKVEHMNASPSLEFDVMRATDLVRRPVHAARLLLQDVHPAAAPLAALREGAAPRRRARPAAPRASPSASGAPSTAAATPTCWSSAAARPGCSAAIAAAELGADVVLCDEGPEPGGRLLAEGGHERAARAGRAGPRRPGVELLASAPALGAFDGLVPVWQGDTLHQVRARRASSTPPARSSSRSLFAGNDLPGVMLSGGARAAGRAVRRRARATRAVVAAVVRPRARGRRSRCTTPASSWPPWPTCAPTAATRGLNELMRRGVRPLRGTTVLEARGRDQRAGRGASAARRRRGRAASTRSTATCSSSPAAARRPPRCCRRRAPAPRYDERAACFVLAELPDGVLRRRRGRRRRRRSRTPSAPARSPAPRPRTRSGSATSAARARDGRRLDGASRRPPEVAVPPAVTSRRQRQVLRLPVRGRDRQGHPPVGRGGLRLDRAVQALHDHDDGPLPGPHVPAARRCG